MRVFTFERRILMSSVLWFVVFAVVLSCALAMGDTEMRELREEVREAFEHAYGSYKANAFPSDELLPLSCTGSDNFGSYALTLIDSLDTLAVLGHWNEFKWATKWLSDNLDFDTDVDVSVFETNIRVVGGLIAAHMIASDENLSPHYHSYDGRLLVLAEDMGQRLLQAFDTPTGIPFGTINLKRGVSESESNITATATAGTLILEFGALSALTGDPAYIDAAHTALLGLWKLRSPKLGLVGAHVNIMTGEWTQKEAGIGTSIDSYYEYLLKGHILLDNQLLLDLFREAYLSATTALSRDSWYVEVHMDNGGLVWPIYNSLQTFWSGLEVSAGLVNKAANTHAAHYGVWKAFGATPEGFNLAEGRVQKGQESYPLRPEFVESTVLLYRATRDPHYLAVGRDILTSLQMLCRVPCGFAALEDVRTHQHMDRMDSYFLAETLKYLFLLFDPENTFLSRKYVFNTEGHLLDIHRVRHEALKHEHMKAFVGTWSDEDGANIKDDRDPELKIGHCPVQPYEDYATVLDLSLMPNGPVPDHVHSASKRLSPPMTPPAADPVDDEDEIDIDTDLMYGDEDGDDDDDDDGGLQNLHGIQLDGIPLLNINELTDENVAGVGDVVVGGGKSKSTLDILKSSLKQWFGSLGKKGRKKKGRGRGGKQSVMAKLATKIAKSIDAPDMPKPKPVNRGNVKHAHSANSNNVDPTIVESPPRQDKREALREAQVRANVNAATRISQKEAQKQATTSTATTKEKPQKVVGTAVGFDGRSHMHNGPLVPVVALSADDSRILREIETIAMKSLDQGPPLAASTTLLSYLAMHADADPEFQTQNVVRQLAVFQQEEETAVHVGTVIGVHPMMLILGCSDISLPLDAANFFMDVLYPRGGRTIVVAGNIGGATLRMYRNILAGGSDLSVIPCEPLSSNFADNACVQLSTLEAFSIVKGPRALRSSAIDPNLSRHKAQQLNMATEAEVFSEIIAQTVSKKLRLGVSQLRISLGADGELPPAPADMVTILIENESTHTGANMEYTLRLAQATGIVPQHRPSLPAVAQVRPEDIAVKTVLVTEAMRLRRAAMTFASHWGKMPMTWTVSPLVSSVLPQCKAMWYGHAFTEYDRLVKYGGQQGYFPVATDMPAGSREFFTRDITSEHRVWLHGAAKGLGFPSIPDLEWRALSNGRDKVDSNSKTHGASGAPPIARGRFPAWLPDGAVQALQYAWLDPV